MDRNFEQEYKKAFEAAKGLHEAGNALTKKQMEIVFPQLAESEDERIRKEIIEYLKLVDKGEGDYAHPMVSGWIAWLEKQKEQKSAEINLKALLTADRLASAEMTGRLKERSEILENPDKYGLQKAAEWSEEDNIGWDEAFACVTKTERAAKDEGELQNAVTAEKWLKEIKFKYCVHPQSEQEWSEEDENALTYLHELIGFGYSEKFMDAQTSADMREWVNKSLRHSWKPTEEQMKALQWWSGLPSCSPGLKSLYEDLKKLI